MHIVMDGSCTWMYVREIWIGMAPNHGKSRCKKCGDMGERKKIKAKDISFENQGWGDVSTNLVTGEYCDDYEAHKIR